MIVYEIFYNTLSVGLTLSESESVQMEPDRPIHLDPTTQPFVCNGAGHDSPLFSHHASKMSSNSINKLSFTTLTLSLIYTVQS